MDLLIKAAADYARDVSRLVDSSTTTEPSYYPAIRALLAAVLQDMKLPFDVRVNTSEFKGMPDLAFYDGAGEFVVLFGEVKGPEVELAQLARSTGQKDQVGRYLEVSRAVLLCNVRSFGLITVRPGWTGEGPVPPDQRRLEEYVDLWPSIAAMSKGIPPEATDLQELAAVVEIAVTRHAPIGEPESLARILARQARKAKADLPSNFTQAVQGLLDDFGKALGITFEGSEGEEFFRSSLIQTAFYGLFAGWALWSRGGQKESFRWRDLSDYLKIPFLGELFYQFGHPTRIKELGLAHHLDIATETLGRVDKERFFGRFTVPSLRPDRHGHVASTASAILYFYEPFLEAFDPELRKELGVWYTPSEIVRYQVRRVDLLLRERLGCQRGLADEDVVVLDPCCGTGAYLIEVLRCIAEQLNREGSAGAMLGSHLLKATQQRVIGFEILTAPFVVAQLQLYLMLTELGVEPDEEHRPAVFLTNALTGWEGPDQMKLNFPELQQERDAAQRVKKSARIIVVLGNPPYNRFAGAPLEEEQDLVDHYKGIRRNSKGKQIGQSELFARWKIRKHLLDDLYVRFFRLAETRIGERAEHGIVSFISNYSFWTGRSHPIMRESLLSNFHEIWCDSLNGDVYKSGSNLPKELDVHSDESVFSTDSTVGIKVGTGITTLLKQKGAPTHAGKTSVNFRQFWGRSQSKRNALLESLNMQKWTPSRKRRAAAMPEGPRHYEVFIPEEKNRWKLVPIEVAGGFEEWPGLDELFPSAYQGVNHNRGLEGGVIETEKVTLGNRMKDYFSSLSFENFAELHPGLATPRARYDPKTVRMKLNRNSAFKPERIVPYTVFPLDGRLIYYETEAKLLNERRPELWDNLPGNRFLVTVPQPRRASESRPLMAGCLFDLHVHDRGSVGFPIHRRAEVLTDDIFPTEDAASVANLAEPVWKVLKRSWKLPGNLSSIPAKNLVEKLFHTALALCHAPQYEIDHKDSLAQDWAHLPIPRRRRVLDRIAALGSKVAVLLDPLENPAGVLKETLKGDRRALGEVKTTDGGAVKEADLELTFSYYGSARGRWEERKPIHGESLRDCWGDGTGDLYLNNRVYLAHVPQAVWKYELGGYPVIKKWLGYRDKGRRPGKPLTLQEVEHLRGMIQRIAALLVLHAALDKAYEQAIGDAWTAEELGLREA